jgi:hypothetical protein
MSAANINVMIVQIYDRKRVCANEKKHQFPTITYCDHRSDNE